MIEEGFSGPARALGKSFTVLLDEPPVWQRASQDQASPGFRAHEERSVGCRGAPHNMSPTDSAKDVFTLKTSMDEESH